MADGDANRPAAVSGAPAQRLSIRLRPLINVILIFHLVAIVVSPLSVPPSSVFWDKAWWVFGPYLQLMFLNHGYKYFAPEPGPSTLLAYTLEFDDGRAIQETIPNRSIHPRLLYHRHFMLSEFLNFAPDDWHRTYARHLCRSRGAKSVSMSRMTRMLP